MSELRVLVCGGRNYMDREHVFAVLDALWKEIEFVHIIQGGAYGADLMAKEWALANPNKVVHTQYGANWKLHGPGAGPIRNRRMLYEGKPDVVVAFPSQGNGTANMIDQARKAGIPVRIIPLPETKENRTKTHLTGIGSRHNRIISPM